MRIRPAILQIVTMATLACGYGQGQSDYFPNPGDTMYFLIDRAPENINIADDSRYSNWDISMAKAPFLRPVVPMDPRKMEGNSHFPDADYALKMADQTIHYYKIEGKELYMLGQFGFYVYQLFIPAVIRFDYPFIVNYPSAHIGQVWEYSSQAIIEFPTSYLRPAAISKLPVKADSVRVVMNIDRMTSRDAEGRLKYEIISDEVIRHFTVEEYRYRTLLKVGDKPWQDFSAYVNATELYGTLLRYEYDFLSEEHGIPVASVWVNPQNGQPVRVEYWVRSYLDRFRRVDQLTEPGIYAFPNPAIGYVNIELNNLKPGHYTVALYNFLAQQVYHETVEVNSDETIRIDITEFDKGPYLYALIDQYGRRIMTKRLTILKP